MKMMKLALLGGAALAVTTVSAMADDLSALKSSMENMGMVAAPVADAPEGATITWSGHVRQALTWTHVSGGLSDDGIDLNNGRARLTVNATTPTSVGDVDVHVQFGATQGQPRGGWGVGLVDYSGTWHITPELSFTGGRLFTGGEGQGETFGNTVNLSPSFATTTDNALQLGYASGPVSFVIGVENGDEAIRDNGFDSNPDFYANMGWKGDMFSVGLQGNYETRDATADNYQAGANVSFNLSDAISMHVNGVVGHEECAGLSTVCVAGRGDYWGVAGGAKANVTEATYVELTGGYVNADAWDRYNVNAGIYWAPASALTIGLQGDYTVTKVAGPDTKAASASLVTWWRF